jgi:hypothetical protein
MTTVIHFTSLQRINITFDSSVRRPLRSASYFVLMLGPHEHTKCVPCNALCDVRSRNRKKPIDPNIRVRACLAICFYFYNGRHKVRYKGRILCARVAPALIVSSLSRSLILWSTVSRPVCLGIKYPSRASDQIFISVRQLWVCRFGALSLTRWRACRLRFLLGLASAVILESHSRWTRDHILLSQIRNFLFRRLLRLAGSRWRIRFRIHTGLGPQSIGISPLTVICRLERETLIEQLGFICCLGNVCQCRCCRVNMLTIAT